MRKTPPNTAVRCPPDYIEMMRAYFPKVSMALIKDAWLHNATPTEVRLYLEATEQKT